MYICIYIFVCIQILIYKYVHIYHPHTDSTYTYLHEEWSFWVLFVCLCLYRQYIHLLHTPTHTFKKKTSSASIHPKKKETRTDNACIYTQTMHVYTHTKTCIPPYTLNSSTLDTQRHAYHATCIHHRSRVLSTLVPLTTPLPFYPFL